VWKLTSKPEISVALISRLKLFNLTVLVVDLLVGLLFHVCTTTGG
jgi:hypothetical protein